MFHQLVSLISFLSPFYLQTCSSPQHPSKITFHLPSCPFQPHFPSHQAQNLYSVTPFSFPGTILIPPGDHHTSSSSPSPLLLPMCPHYCNTPFSLLLSNSLVLLSNGPHSVSKKFSFALYTLGLRPGPGVPVISVALPGLCPGIAVYSRSSHSLTFLFTEPALFIMDVFCPATVFALLSTHLDSSKVSWNPSPWPSLPPALTAHDGIITPS